MIGNYKILEKIGSGGMGDVFRGLDVMLEREVAIKSLRPELSQREDLINRFRSEAVAMGRLSHPNIATVYNFLYQGGQYFLVMEFVRGQTLDKLLEARGAMNYAEALPYLCAVLDGLEHAHRYGIVHRDIKPSNIMLTPSGLKLMDFGIARILQQARQTRSGHMVGTLEYMSPEHIQGLDTDARTDIYSVGVVAYELLTGHLPFRKDTDYEMIKAQVEEIPRPLRDVVPDLPDNVAAVVDRALQKNADDRYQSAADFADALEGCLEGTGASVRRTPTDAGVSGAGGAAFAKAKGKGLSSRQMLWGALGLVGVLLLVGLGFLVMSYLQDANVASNTARQAANQAKPVEQLRQAATSGDAEAQVELGNRYAEGNGLAKDPAQALDWYRKAADAGLGKAKVLVGEAYLLGRGTSVDIPQAMRWLEPAAKDKVPGAAGLLGQCYDKQEKYAEALQWFLKSQEQGDAKAPLRIGFAYVEMEDYSKAIPWLQQAADAGEGQAKFSLGMIYFNGYSVEKDFKKAVRYFEAAANQNLPEAEFMLGVMYHYGYGVTADLEQAKKWLRLALTNGYEDAAKELKTLP